MIEKYLEEYPVSYLCPRITIKRDRCDGLPCVRGTDITAISLAILANDDISPEEIIQIHPTLTMEDLIDVYVYYQGTIRMFSHYEEFILTRTFSN